MFFIWFYHILAGKNIRLDCRGGELDDIEVGPVLGGSWIHVNWMGIQMHTIALATYVCTYYIYIYYTMGVGSVCYAIILDSRESSGYVPGGYKAARIKACCKGMAVQMLPQEFPGHLVMLQRCVTRRMQMVCSCGLQIKGALQRGQQVDWWSWIQWTSSAKCVKMYQHMSIYIYIHACQNVIPSCARIWLWDMLRCSLFAVWDAQVPQFRPWSFQGWLWSWVLDACPLLRC